MTSNLENSDYLSVSMLLKAVPVEDGGRRFIYCEASNEAIDIQGERVLQKALADSMDYMLSRGNLDIDHYTLIGPKQGIPDYLTYEIGRPVDIRIGEGRTLVKGEIYSGTGISADKANQFWSSLTEQFPPAQWFPSIGGSIQKSEVAIDPSTKSKHRRITKVRWSNIGFSKQPVNHTVPFVQTAPMDVFTKSLVSSDGFILKTLEAGYGSDVSSLVGGGALRMQSLHGYEDYRNSMSRLILDGVIDPADGVFESISRFGLTMSKATAWFNNFLTDVKNGRTV